MNSIMADPSVKLSVLAVQSHKRQDLSLPEIIQVEFNISSIRRIVEFRLNRFGVVKDPSKNLYLKFVCPHAAKCSNIAAVTS